jgi:hypothetical protein
LLREHFFAQAQHAKRDELAVEIFALATKDQVERVVLNTLPVVEDRIHAGIADAGYKPARLTQCALKKLV